jgi:hypothetical protein
MGPDGSVLHRWPDAVAMHDNGLPWTGGTSRPTLSRLVVTTAAPDKKYWLSITTGILFLVKQKSSGFAALSLSTIMKGSVILLLTKARIPV